VFYFVDRSIELYFIILQSHDRLFSNASGNGNVAMAMNKKTEAETRARNVREKNDARKSASNFALPKLPVMPAGHTKHQPTSDQKVVELPRLFGANKK